MSVPYRPALAKGVPVLPAADALPGGCAYEPKYDGWRAAIVVPADGGPRLLSRHGARLDERFPEIAAAGAGLPAGTVLDGELLAWRDGALAFPALAGRGAGGRPAPGVAYGFAAFDVLELAGVDARPLPYERRRELLLEVVGPGGLVSAVPMTTDPATAAEWFDALVPLGVEGLVVKGRAQPYRPGARSWLKVKHRHTRELVVGATAGLPRTPVLVLGAGSPTAAGGRLRLVGRTTPLDPAVAAAVLPRLVPAGAAHPWPAELPARAVGAFARGSPLAPVPIRRVVPALVVEVVVDAACDQGRYRHPLLLLRVRDEP